MTVNVNVAVSSAGVKPAGLAVTVIVYVPGVADDATVIVRVDDAPAMDGVTEAGLIMAVTPWPDGDTAAERVIDWAVPPVSVAVTVAVVVTSVVPMVTVPLAGLTLRL